MKRWAPLGKVRLLLLIAVLTMGCSFDLSSENEVPELPDVPPFELTGPWILSIQETSPSLLPTIDTAGACVGDPILVSVVYQGRAETEFLYAGSHGRIRMVCSGVSEPATLVFGLEDSVIVVEAGAIKGQMHYEPCVWNPVSGCTPHWLVGLELDDFRFRGFADAEPIGGGFHWPPYSDTARVFGRWSIQRPTSSF
jgi:hypothetical protein